MGSLISTYQRYTCIYDNRFQQYAESHNYPTSGVCGKTQLPLSLLMQARYVVLTVVFMLLACHLAAEAPDRITLFFKQVHLRDSLVQRAAVGLDAERIAMNVAVFFV